MESQSLLPDLECIPLETLPVERPDAQKRSFGKNMILGPVQVLTLRAWDFFHKVYLGLIPSFLSHTVPIRDRSGHSTAFLNGLRGIFAIAVVNQHILGFFEKSIYYGYGLSADESTHCSYQHQEVAFSRSFFQLPLLRLIYAGDAGVCVFFVLSGFVLSFRALGEAHSRHWQEMFNILSSSTFRRGLRLFLPLVVSTIFNMITLQFGLWEPTRRILLDPAIITGVPEYHPERMSTFSAQFKRWLRSWSHLTNIWSWDEYLSPYDVHLWTIPSEFRASMLLYLILLSTGRILPVIRGFLLISFSIYAYCWNRWDVCLFLSGALLADTVHARENRDTLGDRPDATKRPWKNRLKVSLQVVSTTCSLLLLSSPTFCVHYTPGYRLLAQIIPSFDRQPFRFFPGLGAIILVGNLVHANINSFYGVHLLRSPFFQYLGRISYSIYILHGPLLHMMGYPLFPLLWEITGKDETWRYTLGFFAGWLILFFILVWVSDVFCRWIDEGSVRFSKWLESTLLA